MTKERRISTMPISRRPLEQAPPRTGALGRTLLLTALAFGLAACSNTVEGVKRDAEENKVPEKAEKAAQAVKEAVHEAGHELREHALALDIKGALMLDKAVDASHIKVEADDETRTVRLEGSVPSDAQRAAAEAIARRKAKDYQVKNLLTVGA
jgi:osmotically-inducible protein OsmY